MATTRPQPVACIAGTAALHIATTDNRLRSMRGGIGVDVRRLEVAGRRAAGVGDEDVDPAERLGRHGRRTPAPPAAPLTSHTSGMQPWPIVDGGLLDAVLVAAADGDRRTLGGERLRRAETQPAGRRRDGRPPPRDAELHAEEP